MKILWITNAIFPSPAKSLNLPNPVFGGWMFGMAEDLVKNSDIELAVATIYSGHELKISDEHGIRYFLLPSLNSLKYQESLEGYWIEVCNLFKPDIVHIHGTEYPHGLACINKLPYQKYVVSIQGIITIYERYYLGGISIKDICKNITFRDIIRMDTLFQAKKKLRIRSIYEREFFRKTTHLIGRTAWDKAHAAMLAPQANYHFCNESLRETFYTSKKWDIGNCLEYSIFLSQAFYPLKGLHQVIKAVALLKSEFPSIIVRVAGPDITRSAGWKDRLRISGYGRYIRTLIKSYHLEDHIEFTGELSEEGMKENYLGAHAFVCPSMIENSPNSLGEAQILGVPSVAAYVGGVPDMVVQDDTGILYRFEEVEMLAHSLRKIFLDAEFAKKLSFNGIIAAERRHNRLSNSEKTRSIYLNLFGK